jgi:hypothetical protein
MHSCTVESGNPVVLFLFGRRLQVKRAIGHFNVETRGVHSSNASVIHFDFAFYQHNKTFTQNKRIKLHFTLRSRIVFSLEIHQQIAVENKPSLLPPSALNENKKEKTKQTNKQELTLGPAFLSQPRTSYFSSLATSDGAESLDTELERDTGFDPLKTN